MGKIIVGREKSRVFETTTGFEGRKAPQKRGPLSIEEQRALASKLIEGKPENQWVGILLSHGLKDVADEVNESLVKKALAEQQAKAESMKAKEEADSKPSEDAQEPAQDDVKPSDTETPAQDDSKPSETKKSSRKGNGGKSKK